MPKRNLPEPDPATWLTADQQRCWRSLVHLLMRLPPVLEADLQQSAGITMFEYLVLSGLSEAPHRRMRLSHLAAAANSSLSRLSHVLSRLEARGCVRRRTCPGAGRRTEAILTADGLALIINTAPRHVETVRSLIIDALTSAQLQQLGTTADTLTDSLARYRAPADSQPRIRGRRPQTSRLTTE